VVAEHAAGALEAHDLRTRNAGQTTFLQFHLVVPGEMLSPGGLRALDKRQVPEVVVEHVARGILVPATWSRGSPETQPVATEPSRP